MRDVHRHLEHSTRAHAQTHEDALREAAVARAQTEAAGATPDQPEASQENRDDG
jgi:hypothetical protein